MCTCAHRLLRRTENTVRCDWSHTTRSLTINTAHFYDGTNKTYPGIYSTAHKPSGAIYTIRRVTVFLGYPDNPRKPARNVMAAKLTVGKPSMVALDAFYHLGAA